ncbi:MAG TPA: hypothetical protein VEJ84_16640 [Acidimicrobiales bacterium]|nr:hypothetical protein [Acidimicrobiales bacterium]
MVEYENIRLKVVLLSPADLVKTTVHVVRDRPDLVAVWDVVAVWRHMAPRTLLGVTVIGCRDRLVEIEGMAALSS